METKIITPTILYYGTPVLLLSNLRHHPECVVNVPAPSLWKSVEALAPFTGRNPVPEDKKELNYRYEKDKFGASGLSAVKSIDVQPDRINECPLQIEAKVMNIRIPEHSPDFAIVEAEAGELPITYPFGLESGGFLFLRPLPLLQGEEVLHSLHRRTFGRFLYLQEIDC